MGKIVLLVPREDMLYQAHNILQEKKYFIDAMERVDTENVVEKARQYIAEGASLIIARGVQALLIKQNTDIPVVEIALTGQEMGLLVTKAKQIVKKECPVISVVGFANMFHNMSYFDELYQIQLRTYFVSEWSELKSATNQAIADGADVILGGDTVVAAADAAGIPSLFVANTEDSMRNALASAKNMEFAMEAERRNSARFEILEDYSLDGVLYLDNEGRITSVNEQVLSLLEKPEEDVVGKMIWDIFPGIKADICSRVLQENQEHSTYVEVGHIAVLCTFMPVQYADHLDSVMVLCHRAESRRQTSGGYKKNRTGPSLPLLKFEDILQESPSMQKCIHQARLYAASDYPVVITGEAGTERRSLARCIHSASSRENGPFIDFVCSNNDDATQKKELFGPTGAAAQAQNGSLLLLNVESLTNANQYRLYQMIRFRTFHDFETGKVVERNPRIMVITERPLRDLAAQGKLRRDLCYALNALELNIPPIRERPEDLEKKLKETLQQCLEKYERYHVLTTGAKDVLRNYSWPGNLLQIDSFFERLVLTAEKRSLDEVAVAKLLKEMDPQQEACNTQSTSQSPVQVSEEAKEIARVLKECNGNRTKAAEQLGISKTTLWRHIKKYELDQI